MGQLAAQQFTPISTTNAEQHSGLTRFPMFGPRSECYRLPVRLERRMANPMSISESLEYVNPCQPNHTKQQHPALKDEGQMLLPRDLLLPGSCTKAVGPYASISHAYIPIPV